MVGVRGDFSTEVVGGDVGADGMHGLFIVEKDAPETGGPEMLALLVLGQLFQFARRSAFEAADESVEVFLKRAEQEMDVIFLDGGGVAQRLHIAPAFAGVNARHGVTMLLRNETGETKMFAERDGREGTFGELQHFWFIDETRVGDGGSGGIGHIDLVPVANQVSIELEQRGPVTSVVAGEPCAVGGEDDVCAKGGHARRLFVARH